MSHKNDTLSAFSRLYKQISNEKNFRTVKIRSDHGTEFDNQDFEKFCTENKIDHNFFAPRTPQQNEVIERKNRMLVDIARTMLYETKMPKYFWAEAINSACHILNRVSIRPIIKRTPYELYYERKPTIS